MPFRQQVDYCGSEVLWDYNYVLQDDETESAWVFSPVCLYSSGIISCCCISRHTSVFSKFRSFVGSVIKSCRAIENFLFPGNFFFFSRTACSTFQSVRSSAAILGGVPFYVLDTFHSDVSRISPASMGTAISWFWLVDADDGPSVWWIDYSLFIASCSIVLPCVVVRFFVGLPGSGCSLVAGVFLLWLFFRYVRILVRGNVFIFPYHTVNSGFCYFSPLVD